ncbi:Domain of unknown function DUF1801 [Fibrisoma limi BUZ 3]|uniref:YdhG-like domain-containing protein n=1 Tax=Fibrisoma limi BUZ 3 TaxID=1185876 RepID=I2GPC8_9BACT|nr:DUF1801 domain-containing protein [Fibrisoma limi]CCH55756.1 Domain of unknown function DUF1801 [Fibrisoma limi BUZ 3]
MMTTKPNTIDEYIALFPANVQTVLQQVRATIRKAAPEAQETIKYAMPTYVLNGNLVYFAAFQHHIGFYATPTGNEAFKEDLSGYKTGKGSIQFPLSQPMPLDLITKIVTFRVHQNQEWAMAKKKGKQSA